VRVGAVAAERLGTADIGSGPGQACAFVFKVSNSGAMGRLTYARILGGTLKEGAELKGPDGDAIRIGTLFAVQGEKTAKLGEAKAGDVVAIAKIERRRPPRTLPSRPETTRSPSRPRTARTMSGCPPRSTS
jgi:translation elongation factor EF-G